MTRRRWLLLGGLMLASLGLAYVLRDVIRVLIIVPVAYLVWVAGLLYTAVPQFIRWIIVVLLAGIAIIWQLVPEAKAPARRPVPLPRAEGKVEALAVWFHRSQGSNYFKWQIANRLGRMFRHLEELAGARLESPLLTPHITDYLTAGIERSFVDFPTQQRWFGRPSEPTALDVDPGEVVEFLESYSEESRG